jgi:outer membrane protein insertion porin family
MMKKMMNKQLKWLFILVGFLSVSWADTFDPFTIKAIRIKGLQRVSEGAVLDDLPFRINDTMTEADAAEGVKALYKTGFFKEVSFARDGNALVVNIIERPTISKLILSGIKDKEKIKKLLKEGGLAEGRFYDPTILLQTVKELERYYLGRGRYGVKIEPIITGESTPLVTVELSIYEGDVAKIKEIKIMGNQAFSEKELLKEFRLAKTNWLSWFSSDDQYNKEKLNADLETLRSFYMDRGYIRFQIDSSQAALSADKKHIFISVHVVEGEKYLFGESDITGKFVVPKEKMMALLGPLKAGNTFSRKTLFEVKSALEDRLGEEGYSHAEVQPTHQVNEKDKTVEMAFNLVPGKRIYVRRIIIKGNATTQDEVLRRELPQMEGTWISTALVKEGKEKILRRGYGSQVDVETPAVPGVSDQVDVVYKIEEARLGQLGAGVGYSPSERIMFNFSLSQENFFGTGKGVDFTFDNSKASTNYGLGYQDPYFTIDGVGMGFNAYYNKTDLSKTTDVSSYSTDTLGGEVRWVFPMSLYDAIRLSVGYDKTHLKTESIVATEISDFMKENGDQFREFTIRLGWSYDSLDQRIFPHKGMTQSLSILTVVPGANQQYYKLSYDLASYHPLSNSELWILGLSSNLGYGDGYGKTSRMPFYRNYVAGGTRFVRGFVENSLGPKDSLGRAFGGNALLACTASLIFPNPIKPDAKSVRTALFFDAGQVYDTRYRYKTVNGLSVARNPQGLRYAVGMSLTWHTPLGGAPVSFSLAKPLQVKRGDEIRRFNFWMGTQF